MRVLLLIAGLMAIGLLALNVNGQAFIPAETDHVSTSLSPSDYTGSSYYGDLADDEDSNTLSSSERLSVPSGNPFPVIFKNKGEDDEDTTQDDSSNDAARMAPAALLIFAAFAIL